MNKRYYNHLLCKNKIHTYLRPFNILSSTNTVKNNYITNNLTDD